MSPEPDPTPVPAIVQVVAAKPSGPTRKSRWDSFIQLMPLLQAITVAGIGIVFTSNVTNAIQKRQLELNNVKEMQSVLAKLYEKQTPAELAANVAALTAFGEYSIPPLTILLQSSEANTRTAAESGFRALALSDSELVAAQLIRVVGARNRICSWRMLESAARLLGDLGCRQARPQLADLSARLSNPDHLQAVASLARISDPDSPPDTTIVAEVKSVVDVALAQIDATAGSEGR